jgi:hypothetical protein
MSISLGMYVEEKMLVGSSEMKLGCAVKQGCQIVYFKTIKNSVGTLWKAFE